MWCRHACPRGCCFRKETWYNWFSMRCSTVYKTWHLFGLDKRSMEGILHPLPSFHCWSISAISFSFYSPTPSKSFSFTNSHVPISDQWSFCHIPQANQSLKLFFYRTVMLSLCNTPFTPGCSRWFNWDFPSTTCWFSPPPPPPVSRLQEDLITSLAYT